MDCDQAVPGSIYFIGANARQWIKIGWTSRDPEKRLRGLQSGNALDLELILAVAGTRAEEAQLHIDFARDAVRTKGHGGEWFHISPRLKLLLWCLGAGPAPSRWPPGLEKLTREKYAWLLRREPAVACSWEQLCAATASLGHGLAAHCESGNNFRV